MSRVTRQLHNVPLVESAADVPRFDARRNDAVDALQLNREAHDPVTAYALAYAYQLDDAIVRKLRQMLKRAEAA